MCIIRALVLVSWQTKLLLVSECPRREVPLIVLNFPRRNSDNVVEYSDAVEVGGSGRRASAAGVLDFVFNTCLTIPGFSAAH